MFRSILLFSVVGHIMAYITSGNSYNDHLKTTHHLADPDSALLGFFKAADGKYAYCIHAVTVDGRIFHMPLDSQDADAVDKTMANLARSFPHYAAVSCANSRHPYALFNLPNIDNVKAHPNGNLVHVVPVYGTVASTPNRSAEEMARELNGYELERTVNNFVPEMLAAQVYRRWDILPVQAHRPPSASPHGNSQRMARGMARRLRP
jgi:hypothetical protein